MTTLTSDLLLERLYTPTGTSSPATWVEDRLGETVWSKQREVLEALTEHRRVAVKSCHGVGKSHIASRVAAWWLDTHPPGEAFVVTTAPTFAQVRAILWRYIGQAHRKGGLRGRVNQTEWHIGDEIVGYGRKPSDYDESGFQGIHARYVLVIIDEACGVPRSLWTAVTTLLTNEDCRALAIGNPDDPNTYFGEVFGPESAWHPITISAFDSPNFTGERVPAMVARELISQAWVAEAKTEWGEDSAVYRSKVLGEFPEDSEDSLIPATGVAACRHLEPFDADADTTDVQLGVDVGAGGDKSVIYERRGSTVGRVWRSQHRDAMRLAGEIVQAVEVTGARRVTIDVIGWGWGVKGRVEEVLAERGSGVTVDGVNVGERSRQPQRFKNLKAEIWWDVGRKLTQDRAWDLGAIDDRTAADLSAPEWGLDSSGRIWVESKGDVTKRLGRSTDDADALLLAFYQRTQRATIHRPRSLSHPLTSGAPGRFKL